VDNNVENLWIKMWKIRQHFHLHKLNFFDLYCGIHKVCGKEKFSTRKKIFKGEKKSRKALSLMLKMENSLQIEVIFEKIIVDFQKEMKKGCQDRQPFTSKFEIY
jgi:hypothetical protein